MDEINDYKLLTENLLFTYRQFCTNRVLHEKVDHDLYEKFVSMWNMLLLSLEDNYLLGLAKILERNEFKKFKDKLQKHDATIGKIKNLRNKLFAHLDLRKMRKIDEFLQENGLNCSEITALFDTAIEIADQLNGHSEKQSDLRQLFNRTKEEVCNECDAWLRLVKSLS